MRPAAGRTRYLLRAHREACAYCSTGTRTVSLWATSPGKAEEVAWCGHCFNATCETVPLDEEHLERFQSVRETVTRGKAPRTWAAVRPALEDLERRGVF